MNETWLRYLKMLGLRPEAWRQSSALTVLSVMDKLQAAHERERFN